MYKNVLLFLFIFIVIIIITKENRYYYIKTLSIYRFLNKKYTFTLSKNL